VTFATFCKTLLSLFVVSPFAVSPFHRLRRFIVSAVSSSPPFSLDAGVPLSTVDR
jgi:hypothetical protein